jgi:hypothetical protein
MKLPLNYLIMIRILNKRRIVRNPDQCKREPEKTFSSAAEKIGRRNEQGFAARLDKPEAVRRECGPPLHPPPPHGCEAVGI